MKWLVFIMVAHGGLDCDTTRCSLMRWVPFDREFVSQVECLNYIQSPEWAAIIDQTVPRLNVECRAKDR